MPIYEYKCEKCGVFEMTQHITEEPIENCPTCGGRVHRLISHTGFQLKGTGWYKDGYTSSSSGGGSSGTTKSDSK